jgi:hypothetical protein
MLLMAVEKKYIPAAPRIHLRAERKRKGSLRSKDRSRIRTFGRYRFAELLIL